LEPPPWAPEKRKKCWNKLILQKQVRGPLLSNEGALGKVQAAGKVPGPEEEKKGENEKPRGEKAQIWGDEGKSDRQRNFRQAQGKGGEFCLGQKKEGCSQAIIGKKSPEGFQGGGGKLTKSDRTD